MTSPTIQPTIRYNPAQPVRFASGLFVGGTDRMLSAIQKNRTREMLFEDLMGFGFLRTGLDLFRQYFFEKKPGEQRQLNFPAARERLVREVGSIFTDNFSGGMIAWSIAAAMNKAKVGGPNFCNQFASNQTLELFKQLAKSSPNQQSFVKNLALKVSKQSNDRIFSLMNNAINRGNAKGFEDAAVNVARILTRGKGTLQKTLDVGINGKSFALDTLIEDASKFLKFMQTKAVGSQPWSQRATQAIGRTVTINNWRLPVSLGLAMTMTMAMPYLNRWLTRKMDGIDSYPGEMGLRELKRVQEERGKPWYERWFPYVGGSAAQGKFGPALMSLIPLPFAFGLFDTNKLSAGAIGAAFNNPLKKGFLSRLMNMLQFGKGFPFTTQQQMAMCFAFLIFSRLTTARSDIEFRERMVDSFLGWSIWILATPFLKRLIAKKWDPNMLKQAGDNLVLKRRVELERLVCNINTPKEAAKNLFQKGLKGPLGRYVMMGAACLGVTIAMLGIVEPLIAIKWTERQAKRDAARQ